MDDPIRNSPQETPTNYFQATPLKRHRPEISSTSTAPPLQYSRRSLSSSFGGVGMDDMWTSFFTEISGRGDDDFPLADLIDKHFGMEKYHEKVKELGFETALQTSLVDSTHKNFLLRVIGQKFSDIEKENKAFVEEIAELKKLVISLKDEWDKLKKTLDELNVLNVESSKSNVKLQIKEDNHWVTVDRLNAEIEELKYQNSLQYKAGFDNAVNQVIFFA
ncbi:hypothetical protein MTR_5g085150 [Medicago truncatula]|uniref:Uncharacterized protein n=1 Tax=Medicago truncatula TaxID=3880 RepID=G7KH83_MEDTR|nr:hypothetical protein MTR_5g085150 [Medicago truncatula]